MTETQNLPTDEIVARTVTAYIDTVRTNTGPTYDATAAVLTAIATGEGYEIVYELLDTAYAIGVRPGDTDEAVETADAWWDAMADALPTVAKLLA